MQLVLLSWKFALKIFATRVWGFDPENWPLVPFSLEGNRDRLLKMSNAGDMIVFVGTQSEPTEPDERGRILGISEFGRNPVDTLEVLDETILTQRSYTEKGEFRWPKALLAIRAWKFIDKPVLTETLSQQLPFNATSQAVELSEDDCNIILSLRAEEVIIPFSPTLERLRKIDIALGGQSPSRGIIPTSWTSSINREIGNQSYTYAFRFGEANCWKIGYTTDRNRRVEEVNSHIPHEILKQKWVCKYSQTWPNEVMAYNMEQALLGLLAKYRTAGERVICTEDILRSAWIKAIAN